MKQRQFSKVAAGDLGCYDGPPIGADPVADRYRSNAIVGSERLRDAILAAANRQFMRELRP